MTLAERFDALPEELQEALTTPRAETIWVRRDGRADVLYTIRPRGDELLQVMDYVKGREPSSWEEVGHGYRTMIEAMEAIAKHREAQDDPFAD
jgi:hypothetical protein